MNHIDIQFVQRLGISLKDFKRKREDLWNCSCPICGETRQRGYFYVKKDKINFKCHNETNCSGTLSSVMKLVDPTLFQMYVLERFRGKKEVTLSDLYSKPEVDELKVTFKDKFQGLIKISSLKQGHPVKEYVQRRMIPEQYHGDIFVVPRFMEYVNSLFPGTFKNTKYEHPRLLFPFRNQNKVPIGFAARAFGNEEPKYLIMKFDESYEKIYGIDRLNKNKTAYIVEGQIDSLFLENSIAAGGSAFNSEYITSLPDKVFVYDNEPRKPETVANIKKLIDSGQRVCIFPTEITQKDLNDMVKSGIKIPELKRIIDSRTFEGARALLEFNRWKRC
jgi:hypothetical protein